MSTLFRFLTLTAIFLSASCSTILNNLPGVYTLDVQQGNIIDQSIIDQLRPNMTKRQVLYIMGSPMLNDPFRKDGWDYLYSNQPGGEARQQKKITLIFEGDYIVGIQGDFRPSSIPVIKTSEQQTVDVPKRELDKTLWEMITGLFDFDDSSGDATESNENKDKTEKTNPISNTNNS